VGLSAVACASIAACALWPREPRGPWLTARTEHFEIASGLSEARTRELAISLERFRAAALAFAGLEERESRVPAQLILFPDGRSFATVRPRRELAGFFQPAVHKSFVVVDAGRRDQAQRIAQHELVHLLLASDPDRLLPAWYQEGLADVLSTATPVGGALEIGLPPEGRLIWLRLASPLPLGRVLTARDVLRWPSHSLTRFYAQSWALAHYLELPESARTSGALARLLAQTEAGEDPELACNRALGRSLEELEADVARYIASDEPTRLRVRVQVPPLDDRVEISRQAPAERDALLADLALSLGPERWERGERWLRAALAEDPAHALANVSLAWLGAERGDPAAAARLGQVEAMAAGSADLERRIGDGWLALAQRAPASERPALLARAGAGYRRSLALDPAQGASAFGLAQIELASGRAEQAAAELLAARARLPSLPPLELELAHAYLAQGEPERAREPLLRVLAEPHGAGAEGPEAPELDRLLAEAGLASSGRVATRHLAARLDVLQPAPGAELSTDLAWLEVKGHAGLWEAALQDIAIALDVSNSTLDASGVDVDGDGRVGRTQSSLTFSRDPLSASSDRGDSIVRAEIAAARALVAELDASTTRVALVLFTATAKVATPLGPPSAVGDALSRQRVRYDPTGTSFAAALDVAFQALIAGSDPARRSQRTILILSDGEPTVPDDFRARSEALAAAERLAELGVRVHSFALGEKAREKSDTLRELTERTGGRFALAEDLGRVSFLRDVRLTGLDGVTIRNGRSGELARGVRVRPDGSFDGFVRLLPGENPLEISALVEDRDPLVVERSVLRVAPSQDDASAASRAAELLRDLRGRTQEISLQAELEARRAERSRRTLRIEGAPAVSAPPPDAEPTGSQ
jgi:hypothetical protein